MKTVEYLNDCKKKLDISSTYALAKELDLSEQLLSNYYRGKHEADDYTCFKIAETLDLDPAYVIASVKAESEKNEKKKNYFRSFSSASRKVAASIVLAVVLNLFYPIVQGIGEVKTAVAVFLRWVRFV